MTFKPYLTNDELIRKISSKGLEITCRDSLQRELNKYSYNKLFTPYKIVFQLGKIDGVHNYEGLTSCDFLDCFKLDSKISFVLLKCVLDIEQKVKNAFINVVCSYYNEVDFTAILQHVHSNTTKSNTDRLIKMYWKWMFQHIKFNNGVITDEIKLDKAIIHNYKDREVKHYLEKYNMIPAWVFINKMTLGNLEELISFLESPLVFGVRDYLSTDSELSRKEFVTCIVLIRKIRNLLAHGYNISTIHDSTLRDITYDGLRESFENLSIESFDSLMSEMSIIINNSDLNNLLSKVPRVGSMLNDILHDLTEFNGI